MNPSKVLLTGCSRSVGAYIYEQLGSGVGEVVGLGLGGPDVQMDFRQLDCENAGEIAMMDALNTTIDPAVPFDAAIHNAGMTSINKLTEFNDDQWDDVMMVNLTAPFFLTKAWVQHVLHYEEKDESHPDNELDYRAIFIGSMGSKMALRHSYSYCASKAGLTHLVRTLAKSFTPPEPDFFTFLQLNPNGIDDTAMIDLAQSELCRTRGWDEQRSKDYIVKGAPLGRLITHDEVWQAVKSMLFHWPHSASGGIFDITGAMGI